MNLSKIGFKALVSLFDPSFIDTYKDCACYAYGEDLEGNLFCFLGFDLVSCNAGKPVLKNSYLSDWTYYAKCIVLSDGQVIIKESKLPVSPTQ